MLWILNTLLIQLELYWTFINRMIEHLYIGLLLLVPFTSRALLLIKSLKQTSLTIQGGPLSILPVQLWTTFFFGFYPDPFVVSAGHENVVQELIGSGADVIRKSGFLVLDGRPRMYDRKGNKGMTALWVMENISACGLRPCQCLICFFLSFFINSTRYYAASKSCIDVRCHLRYHR